MPRSAVAFDTTRLQSKTLSCCNDSTPQAFVHLILTVGREMYAVLQKLVLCVALEKAIVMPKRDSVRPIGEPGE